MSNDALTNNNRNGVSNKNAESASKNVIADRLTEAWLDTKRFIDVINGAKRSRVKHDHPKNHLPPDLVDGNYGVYTTGNLIVVDVDDEMALPDCLRTVLRDRETFTVESPHAEGLEGHYYFVVDENINGTRKGWGEIRAGNEYVVGPGSELNGCGKDWCDVCEVDGQGVYTVSNDASIAPLSADALPVRSSGQDEASTVDSGDVAAEVTAVEDVNAPFGDLDQRLQAFLDDETRKKLWTAQWAELGYDDTSTPEMALVAHLGWFFEGDAEVVGQLMNLACHQHPGTDLGKPRKWAVEDRASYRQPTLAAMPDYEETYESGRSHIGPRPDVSHITYENVMVATAKVGPARVQEITDHEANDRSDSQTRRALQELVDDGVVESEKRPNGKRGPNPTYYSIAGYES